MTILTLAPLACGVVNGLGGSQEEHPQEGAACVGAAGPTVVQMGPDQFEVVFDCPSADTWLSEVDRDTNFGSDSILATKVGSGSSSGEGVILIKWDLADAIPIGVTVDAATVTLFNAGILGAQDRSWAINAPWDENEVTWRERVPGVEWNGTVTGTGLHGDATRFIDTSQTEHTLALDRNRVEDWIANPTQNHGISIGDTTDPNGFNCYSREHTEPGEWPNLTVQYTVVP